MDALQTTLNKMMASFTEGLDTIQEKLPAASATGSPLSVAADLAAFKIFVCATFKALQAQIALLALQVDQGEMRARRKILLVHGIAEEADEKTSALVAKVVVERMKLPDFTVKDISRCHRMGRAVSNKPRPILVKMCDGVLREKIWASKSSLKGSGITVSEFLTKTRHDVFLAARQRFGITKCWTREGCIYVLDQDGTRHRTNTMEELESISLPNVSPAVAAKPRATAALTKGAEKAAPRIRKPASKKK